MGDLSPHFSRHQFACSGFNCCGGSAPIDNRLILALEEFRTLVGQPIHINSGFRCLVYNRYIGSNDSSQHPRGYAADIGRLSGMTIGEMTAVAESIDAFKNGGIGTYETFIHVDIRPDGPSRWEG